MTTIIGGICPRCGQFHDLLLAVDGSIVCRNADGSAERIRQLEADVAAARAEVAALREQMSRMYQAETFTDTDGYPSIRVIKAIERVDENEWAMIIRREALADLRAKVEGMRDGALEGFRSQPHRSHLGTMASTLERVLALIEEAERG